MKKPQLKQLIRETLDEIKVDKPANNQNVFDEILSHEDEDDPVNIESLSIYDSFDDWMDAHYDEDDEDFNSRDLSLVKKFYNLLERGDILLLTVEDSDDLNKTSLTKKYKQIITYGRGYSDVRIILTTF